MKQKYKILFLLPLLFFGDLFAQTAQQTNTMGVNIDTDSEANSFLGKLARGTSISFSELQYLDGVSSNLQTQLNTKAPTAAPTFTGDVTFDTTTLFVDSVNNRVGIKKTNPVRELDISGDIAASGAILANAYYSDSAGPVFTPNGIDLGNSDTTLSRSAAGKLAVEGVDVVSTAGNQTIAGDKTFSGQTELTGQVATSSTSAINRIIGDLRWRKGADSSFRTGSSSWASTVTGSGSALNNDGYVQVRTGTTTGSTALMRIADNFPYMWGKANEWSLGLRYDGKWAMGFQFATSNLVANTDGYIVFGQDYTLTSTTQPATLSWGIRVHDGSIYAFKHNGTTYTESSSLATPPYNNVLYQVQVYCDTTNLYFYLNGSLAWTTTVPDPNGGAFGTNSCRMWINNETTTADCYLFLISQINYSTIE